MDFIKKHYEKVLLGVVLLSLALAVVALPFYIGKQKEELADKIASKLHAPVKPLPPLDERRFTNVLQRLAKPAELNFGKPHNLFNPVPWQRRADGSLIKLQEGNEVGPDAAKVNKVNPLYTAIRFESVGPSGSNYLISVTRDAEPNPKLRRKKSFYVEVGGKNDLVWLTAVKGAADKPELQVTLTDTGAKVSVSAEHPCQRVDGYSVDLRYDPEKGVWPARRIGDKVVFAGDEFTVTAINPVATNQFEVVLSAKSTGKKTTIKYNPEM